MFLMNEVIFVIFFVFLQILFGFKSQVGADNWRGFTEQFPSTLYERLSTMYEI